MPTGSFDLDGLPAVIAGPGLQTGVFLYDPNGGGDNGPYTLVPNLQWIRIDCKEGPHPPVCECRYIQDDALWVNLGWPSQFEQLWPIDVPPSPYVVQNDDRVVVLAQNPDGSTSVLFDGFAQIPILRVGPQTQNVSFAVIGVAVRCWDDPITGRVQRCSDATSINETDGTADIQTDLPVRFNPTDTTIAEGNKGGYKPNASPKDMDTTDSSIGDYPVFVEDWLEVSPDPRQYWDIAKAIKYIFAQYNATEKYVKVPTFTTLDDLLQADYPVDDGEFFDPTDDSSSPILIRDYDASNKPWPAAVSELLSYGGFVMRFDTSTDSDGVSPRTDLKIYRRDAAASAAPKLLYLPPAGSDIDPSTANVTALHLARDCNSIVNAWQVETSQRRVEASFILAPLFQISAGDGAAAGMARNKFWSSTWTSATTAATKRAYRWYGVDELGEGYWDLFDGNWVTGDPFDFSPVFADDDDGNKTYTNRYRPGQRHLISLDNDGHPLKAELAISFRPPETLPTVWNAANDDSVWQTIPTGWKLLEHRLGIEVTDVNPDEWRIGKAGAVIAGGGVVHGILWWANPPDNINGGKPPSLRLTTVIEDDLRMPISVPKRTASPTQFSRWRVADARDHFQYNSVALGSLYYKQDGGDGTNPYVARDDTAGATTHAKQLRAANEFPPLAGSATLPFITPYYEVGDRIKQVYGRGANLTVNVGLDQGEAPSYPWVVGVSWTNDGDRQQTVLQLSDHRAEPRNL